MKQYNLKTATVIVATSLIFLFTSCVGDNIHHTNPQGEDFTPTEAVGNLFPIFTYLMHNTQENDNQHSEQMVGGQYGGYMATTNPWEGTNFGTFNPPAKWVDTPFDNTFVKFYSNFQKIVDKTERKGHIYAWASIMRVGVMLKMVDTYGPIPYSEMGYGRLNAAYESVQDVYYNMIKDIDNSIDILSSYLKEATAENDLLQEYDIVYKGDFNKWMKFANSLKLRMAVRIAAVDTEYAKKAMNEAINGSVGLIDTNADNAFAPTESNPYDKSSNEWGDLAISATLSTYMTGLKDPRVSVYMTKATVLDNYSGVLMGIHNIDKKIYSDGTRFSKPAFTKTSPLLIFCAAETSFLKAEAALRGWIVGGEALARTYYEEGIRLSMEQHEVAIGDYLSGTTSPEKYTDPETMKSAAVANKITVSWDDAGTAINTKLEKIITQKWLAIYPLGFEAWCDYRRTGFPQLFPAQNNLSTSGSIGVITNKSDALVRRLPYPQSEYLGNNANVSHAVATLLGGPDLGSTDLWWAKKP